MTSRRTPTLLLALALLVVRSASALAAETASPSNALLDAAERLSGGLQPPPAPRNLRLLLPGVQSGTTPAAAAPRPPTATPPPVRPTPAGTQTVSPQGNDATPCGQGPRRTINGGIACLAGGETLLVGPGTYDELLHDNPGNTTGRMVPIPGGSSWAAPTTIKAATPGTVTLISTQTPEGWQDMVSLGAQRYIVLDGFVIDGQHRPTNWNAVGARGSYIRISNSEAQECRGAGLWAPNATHHEYLNLHIHHAGWDGRTTTCPTAVCDNPAGVLCDHYCHGYYGSGSGNRMEGSRVHDNDGHGIQWYGSNGVIKNNRVYDTTQGQEIGIGVYGRGNQVEGNVLVRNGVHMIAGQTFVKNTLCGHRTDTGWNGIKQQPGSGSTIADNLLLTLRVGAYVDAPGAALAGNRCDVAGEPGCSTVVATRGCEGLVPPASASPVVTPPVRPVR